MLRGFGPEVGEEKSMGNLCTLVQSRTALDVREALEPWLSCALLTLCLHGVRGRGGFTQGIDVGGPCKIRTYDQRIKSPLL